MEYNLNIVIKALELHASGDITRPAMNGIYIDCDQENYITLVASSGHTLLKYKFDKNILWNDIKIYMLEEYGFYHAF